MTRWNGVPGLAPELFVASATPLLRADEQVFEAMLEGWEAQQRSRNLAAATIESRVAFVRQFQRYTNDWPWAWVPGDVDDYFSQLVSGERRLQRSTVRGYQGHLRLFLEYVADPRYEWTAVCERLFGDHPAQVCFDWNTADHVAEYEGNPRRRALRKRELQDLFDVADERVAELRALGRKGWLAAFRDATMLKVAYAWGLRRREVVMLDLEDFGRNPRAPEFRDRGVVYVRWGKASRGSAPKRRSVLTCFPWSVDVVDEWVEEYRMLIGKAAGTSALWPTERSARLDLSRLGDRFATYRDALGLPSELTLHCLRHSYVTHLIEDGYDPLFVQQQVGHSYASTTALYTSVSGDFRNRVLRDALDGVVSAALRTDTEESR